MTLAGLILLGFGFLIFVLSCIPEIKRRVRAKSGATRVNNKWQVFGTIAIGSFLSVVDHGSVLVALPQIESHFSSDLPTVQWLVVGYALAISVFMLPMGRLGDIVPRKHIYVLGFVIFVLAAALAGVSPNLGTLITAKVIQGIGSAMIQGNGMATIISAFPDSERGRALGYHLSVVASGAIAGPAVGGFIISALDWRWVFFINVPIGIVTIVVSVLVLSSDQRVQGAAGAASRPTFDWLGALLSGVALLLFLLAMGNGDRLGWTSPLIIGAGITSVALLAVFIWWELRVDSPMLELRLFRRKLVAMGAGLGFISFLGSSSSRFLMPFYLQRVLEYSPKDVGLILILPALALVATGPVSGRLTDKFGWRALTVGGLGLSAVAWMAFAMRLTDDSSLLFIIGMLMLQSTGMGLFNTPNNSSILGAVERTSYGVVSSLTQLIRNSANVTSVAIATTVVVVTMGSQGVAPSLDAVTPAVADAFVSGLNRAFLLMGCLLAVGAVIAFMRGERETQLTNRTQPAGAGEAMAGAPKNQGS
jgi:EmrB/QacA subfamily drug resistance transporter